MKKIFITLLFVLSFAFTKAQVSTVLPYNGNISLYRDTVLGVLRINFDILFAGTTYIDIYADYYGVNANGDTELTSANQRMYIEAQSISGNYWLDWKLPGQLRIPLEETNYGIVYVCKAELGDTLVQSNNFSGLPAKWNFRLQFYETASQTVYISSTIAANCRSIPSGATRGNRKRPHPQHPNR